MVAVTGAVLAGGKSRRLGQDKALLHLTSDGEVLMSRVVNDLRPLCDEVIVVGRERDDGFGADLVVPDLVAGAGALGGLYTALKLAKNNLCVVVACDMPFLNRKLLSHMIELSAGYDLVLPRMETYVETLHAVYTKSCLEPIEALLAEGNLRIYDFYDQVRVRYVDRAEIELFDPALLSFFNINTPEQLAQALGILREQGGQAKQYD